VGEPSLLPAWNLSLRRAIGAPVGGAPPVVPRCGSTFELEWRDAIGFELEDGSRVRRAAALAKLNRLGVAPVVCSASNRAAPRLCVSA
jgi:hypothetical protein